MKMNNLLSGLALTTALFSLPAFAESSEWSIDPARTADQPHVSWNISGSRNGTALTAIRNRPPLTAELLARGRQRFGIFCSPCHGAGGDGNGVLVQRGMPRPTSYHDDRLRAADDQHFFDVISNGYGVMYSYASRVPPRDRWAIVAYIRALQLSRHASIDDVPPDRRASLTGTP